LPALARKLSDERCELLLVPGAEGVFEVSFPEHDRLPIYVTDAGSNWLCVCYLWDEREIKPRQRTRLLDTLLDLNPAIALSSFGRIGTRFVLFGALGPDSSHDDLALELATLAENASDALASLAEFLV